MNNQLCSYCGKPKAGHTHALCHGHNTPKIIIVGVDPGLTIGFAHGIYYPWPKTPEIKCATIKPNAPDASQDKEFYHDRRAVETLTQAIKTTYLTYCVGTGNRPEFIVGVESFVHYRKSIMNRHKAFTCYEIGWLLGFCRHVLHCQTRQLSKPTHIRNLVPGYSHLDLDVTNDRKLKTALADIYDLKAVNCNNGHTRDALSILTYIAADRGLITW